MSCVFHQEAFVTAVGCQADGQQVVVFTSNPRHLQKEENISEVEQM
jgi:hypothetical protein